MHFQVLLALWKHECKRVIADRFTMPEDVEWFDQALAKLVQEELEEEHMKMVDFGVETFFVDFLRDAPEATGTCERRNANKGFYFFFSICFGSFFALTSFYHEMTFLPGEEPEESDFDLPKVYEPIESFESLKERLNMFLFHFNESVRGTGMDMVFFQDAMIHLIKVLYGYYFCLI